MLVVRANGTDDWRRPEVRWVGGMHLFRPDFLEWPNSGYRGREMGLIS